MGTQEELRNVVTRLMLTHNWSRERIEKHLGHEPKYLTQQVSKGTNKRLLNRLKNLETELLSKATSVATPSAGMVSFPADVYIAKLESDKQSYKESIQLSLNALLEGQTIMRSILVETRDNTRAIRLAVSKDPELEAAYEESKQIAEKLKAQQKGKNTGKAGKV